MKTQAMLVALASLLAAPAAHAAADLSVNVTSSAGDYVYDEVSYSVAVRNVGNQSALNVSLDILLPETNTSPTVYIMGELGYVDAKCAVVGTALSCNLGKIAKNKTKTVYFDLMLPQVNGPLDVTAIADTTSAETNLSNNDDTDTAALLNYGYAITTTSPIHNTHCTGTGLTSFYECTLFPSSQSSHDAVLNANGTISFPLYATFDGTWFQNNPEHLSMTYTSGGQVQAEFEGFGVDGGCFEGITTFPTGGYVSAYRVCL